MEKGKFITFEGIEGVGKSTNMAHFTDILRRGGVDVVTTREPGGTPVAERIRDMVAEHGDEPLPDVAELLLIFAARSVHVVSPPCTCSLRRSSRSPGRSICTGQASRQAPQRLLAWGSFSALVTSLLSSGLMTAPMGPL